MMNAGGGQVPLVLTTEAIQRVLEENQGLIEAIISNQNRGKLDDCMVYQQKLHQNLAILASLSDQQPAERRVMSQAPSILPASEGSLSSKPSGGPSDGGSNEKKEVRYWSEEEHQKFLEGLRLFSNNGRFDLKAIAKHVGTRTPVQIRSHLQKHLLKEKSKSGQILGTGMPGNPDKR